jgi:hypothetical protein
VFLDHAVNECLYVVAVGINADRHVADEQQGKGRQEFFLQSFEHQRGNIFR